MKVLFLTYDLPYPLVSGGKIRAYHLLKGLSGKNKITLFSYYRGESQKKYLSEVKKICQEVKLFKRGKPWSWQNLLRTFSTPLPFASSTYYSSQVKAALKEKLKNGSYDLVYFESYYPALFLPLVKKLGVKAVFGEENVEYQIYERYVQSRQFLPLRYLLKLEVLRMRCYEESLWRQADYNLALSKEDAKEINKFSQKPCPVVPNGVDVDAFKNYRPNGDGKTIFFIGTLIYQANSDAVKFFLKKVYPLVKEKFSGVKFKLVSWHKPDWLEQYLKDSSINFIQDKKTPSVEFFSKADVFVAPMRVASGTNIKVLEAMASGLPVVTTSLGIEGIEAENGKQVVVRDKPEEFAAEVVKLLNDKKHRERLGKNGRSLVGKRYDWLKIGQQFEKILQKIAHE